MFTDIRGSMCADVSTESMGIYNAITIVQGIMGPYISTKGNGMHEGTSTEVSIVKAVVKKRTNVYEKYGGWKTKHDIGTDALGKLRKGISYDDAHQQGL